ncbi:hypothetical protein BGZ83_002300, partial [Gryganskiella cystojenkinii]
MPPDLMMRLSTMFNNRRGPRVVSQNRAAEVQLMWSNPDIEPQEYLKSMPEDLTCPSTEIKERTTNIFKDWTALNHIILRHESLIQKRWLKKTREQRKAILLSAWPDMPTMHRPDFEDFLKESLKPKTTAASPRTFSSTGSRDIYLWPHINQEDLLKPKLFLIFLNARARHYPSAFAEADRDSFRFAITSGKILQDKSRESLETDTSPIQPEPPALSLEEGNIKSLAAISAIAPYRLPASLDLGRLLDLVEARKSAAEDHVWSLREDPGYFADTMMDEKKHRPETFKDIYGQQHSLMLPQNSKKLWERVAKSVIADAYNSLNVWTDIHAKLDKTLTLQKQYQSKIQSSSPLPVGLLEAFLDLQSSLYFYFSRPLLTGGMVVVASQPMRAAFSRLPEAKEETVNNQKVMELVTHPTFAADKARSRFRFLWQALADDYLQERCGKALLLDAMEYLIETTPRGKELVSTRVADMIEYLTLISECLNQISLYQPWASTFPLLPGADSDPSYSRFYYPIDKRRTKETTEAMQEAERNLDEYWGKVDAHLSRKTDVYRQGPVAELLKSRTMYRTTDWVWTEPDPASSIPKTEHRVEDDIIKPLSQLYLDRERVDDAGFKASLPKSKAKTRGVTTIDKDQSIKPVEDDSESAAVDPVFPVDK